MIWVTELREEYIQAVITSTISTLHVELVKPDSMIINTKQLFSIRIHSNKDCINTFTMKLDSTSLKISQNNIQKYVRYREGSTTKLDNCEIINEELVIKDINPNEIIDISIPLEADIEQNHILIVDANYKKDTNEHYNIHCDYNLYFRKPFNISYSINQIEMLETNDTRILIQILIESLLLSSMEFQNLNIEYDRQQLIIDDSRSNVCQHSRNIILIIFRRKLRLYFQDKLYQ